MENAGFREPGQRPEGYPDGCDDPGSRTMRLVDELDMRLRALRGALDARDAEDVRSLAETLAETAREEADCTLIGLEDQDGLIEEMELSMLTERAEDLISFCRMAMRDATQEPIDCIGDDCDGGDATSCGDSEDESA